MENYYEKTKNARHHEFIERIPESVTSVIEFGCGSGRDTIYLLNRRI